MDEMLNKRFDDYKKNKKRGKVAKFVFVGSGNVGKTSLVQVIKQKKYLFQFEEEDREYYRTPFMEIESVSVADLTNGNSDATSKKNEFLLCDIAGQMDLPIHAFKELSDFVLGGVDLIILVFSNDNSQSFLDLDEWITRVKDYYFAKDLPVPAFLLIKNKSDMESAIDPNFIQMLIENEERIIKFIEISCLQGTNIDEFKNFLVRIFN